MINFVSSAIWLKFSSLNIKLTSLTGTVFATNGFTINGFTITGLGIEFHSTSTSLLVSELVTLNFDKSSIFTVETVTCQILTLKHLFAICILRQSLETLLPHYPTQIPVTSPLGRQDVEISTIEF